MRQINIPVIDSDIFKRIELNDDEPVKITFSKQIDDFMISCDGGDILLRWDVDGWNDDECMLLKEKDNFKEINGLRCTHLLIKRKDQSIITVFMVAQLN